MKEQRKLPDLNNGTETTAQTRAETAISQKRAMKELEREFFRQDRKEYRRRLAAARKLVAGKSIWLDATRIVEAFELIGVHPSFALKVWGWAKFRQDLSGAENEEE